LDSIEVFKESYEGDQMGQKENIAKQKQMADAVNQGNFEAFQQIMSPQIIDHDPAPNQGKGPEGFIRFFKQLKSAFPDLHVDAECLVADENNVSIAYTLTGTHEGEFIGIPPTRRKIKARGVQIARFENGLMVERWGSSDELGILNQLGISIPQAA
jgi:steroid delta-isomerase-like uncharacterized protein